MAFQKGTGCGSKQRDAARVPRLRPSRERAPSSQPNLEARLLAQRLDDLVEGSVLEVEADQRCLSQQVAFDLVDQAPCPRTDFGIS